MSTWQCSLYAFTVSQLLNAGRDIQAKTFLSALHKEGKKWARELIRKEKERDMERNGEGRKENRQMEGEPGPSERLTEGLIQISEFYYLFYFYEIF